MWCVCTHREDNSGVPWSTDKSCSCPTTWSADVKKTEGGLHSWWKYWRWGITMLLPLLFCVYTYMVCVHVYVCIGCIYVKVPSVPSSQCWVYNKFLTIFAVVLFCYCAVLPCKAVLFMCLTSVHSDQKQKKKKKCKVMIRDIGLSPVPLYGCCDRLAHLVCCKSWRGNNQMWLFQWVFFFLWLSFWLFCNYYVLFVYLHVCL